jgi:hypothetical protein
MRVVALLAVLAVLASGFVLARSERGRETSRTGGREFSHPAPPLFEFAPASGNGLSPVCACSNVTGSRGETMTFLRSSTASCMKGNTTTGIAPGDLIVCAANQPRIMPGGDGSGGSGLLVEGSKTNLALRSEQFENASWSKQGAARGTAVEANSASCPLAPDGTQTMDLLTFGSADGDGIFNTVTISNNNTVVHSVFVAKKTGSAAACTFEFKDSQSGVGLTNVSAAATLSRVSVTQTSVGTLAGLYIKAAASGCVDVCIWGGQVQQGTAIVGSYIQTTTAAATKLEDDMRFSVVIPATPNTISMAATYVTPSSAGTGQRLVSYIFDANNNARFTVQVTGANGLTTIIGGSTVTTSSTQTLTFSASNRLAAYYDGTFRGECVAGVCTTHAASIALPKGSGTGELGFISAVAGPISGGLSMADGVIKKVCISTDPAGCR